MGKSEIELAEPTDIIREAYSFYKHSLFYSWAERERERRRRKKKKKKKKEGNPLCHNYSKLMTPSRGGSDNRKWEELIPVVQHPVTRTREGIGLDAFHCPHDFRH